MYSSYHLFHTSNAIQETILQFRKLSNSLHFPLPYNATRSFHHLRNSITRNHLLIKSFSQPSLLYSHSASLLVMPVQAQNTGHTYPPTSPKIQHYLRFSNPFNISLDRSLERSEIVWAPHLEKYSQNFVFTAFSDLPFNPHIYFRNSSLKFNPAYVASRCPSSLRCCIGLMFSEH